MNKSHVTEPKNEENIVEQSNSSKFEQSMQIETSKYTYVTWKFTVYIKIHSYKYAIPSNKLSHYILVRFRDRFDAV